MMPSLCQECGRVNAVAARRCIWCGAPMSLTIASADFEAAQMEVEYLMGLDRLDDPAPVRLAVGPSGVEISELLPGSRTVRIASDELIDARVVDASVSKADKQSILRRLLGPFARVKRDRGAITDRHEYKLIIRYTRDGEVREAVFRREDQQGLPAINGLSNVISLLVRRRAGRKP
jgi:hypothetical protein